MVRRMSAQQARDNFGEMLDSVYYTRDTVVVEKRSKPFAIIVNPEEYEELVAKAANRDWETIDRLRMRNVDKSDEEVLDDVTRELAAVRAERRTRRGA